MKEELKATLGITGTNQDALIDQNIKSAKALVESYSGRYFFEKEVTQYAYNRKKIVINHYPAINIIVKKDGEIPVAPKDHNGILHLEERGNYIITYTVVTPDEINELTKAVATRMFKKSKFAGEKSSTNGQGTTNWEDALTEIEKNILDGYYTGI